MWSEFVNGVVPFGTNDAVQTVLDHNVRQTHRALCPHTPFSEYCVFQRLGAPCTVYTSDCVEW
jgi:hypothetical protein